MTDRPLELLVEADAAARAGWWTVVDADVLAAAWTVVRDCAPLTAAHRSIGSRFAELIHHGDVDDLRRALTFLDLLAGRTRATRVAATEATCGRHREPGRPRCGRHRQ